MLNKNIILKEFKVELRNNTSLFLITPTMSVLVILFPILAENRFQVDEDIFNIVRLLFLIIFITLFSIRRPLNENVLIREINFVGIDKKTYFDNKSISELIILYPQVILFMVLFTIFTNTFINSSIPVLLLSSLFFSFNSILTNIYFQISTAFNSRFVQLIIIVPIYIGLSILIAPLWLGLYQEMINIYYMIYLGISLLIYSFISYMIQK
jgi:hypothetical protein